MTDESLASLAGLTQNLCCLTAPLEAEVMSNLLSVDPLMSPKDSKCTLSKHNRFIDKSAAALRQMRQRTTVTHHMYASRP